MHDELWTCPKCGHRFVTRNMWHSCSSFSLDYHFEKSDPAVREIFNRYIEAIESNGPVEIIPQKTRIAIMAKVRFAGCVVRRKWLLANLWMTRKVSHRTLQRTDKFGTRSYGHQFRLTSPDDIDAELRSYIAESYSVGLRGHLKSRRID